MSEGDSKSTLPTNEEIVNDITKNIEHATINDNTSDNQENISNSKNISEIAAEERNDGIPEEFNDESDCIEDDFIDEEKLKELEVGLSDVEKDLRHAQAIELKGKGNEEYKNEKFLESVDTYTQALRLCPLQFESDRSVFYANRGASKIKLDRTKSAIEDCTKAIELNDKYVRAYLRRAKLYEDSDKLDECLEDYKKILELDPGNKDALSATHRLPPLIAERNEKMKTEMFGKLKDLGNLFLRPFGLSTDNFQLQQDPNSGGYSVNFQQNPGNN